MRGVSKLMLLGAVAVGSTGCVGGDPWVGTWLFAYEPNASVSGTCVGEPAEYEVIAVGEDYGWGDIYAGGADGYVVLFDDYLYGTVEDDTLTASWSEQEEGDTSSSQTEYTFVATMDKGLLSGTFEEYTRDEADGVDPEDCRTTTSFTAERTVSDPDAYDVGDEE